MVLVGLGLALVTISFLIYKVYPAKWRKSLQYDQAYKARHPVTSPARASEFKATRSDASSDEAEQFKEVEVAANGTTEKREEPEESTPKARPLPGPANTSIPQLSLNDNSNDGKAHFKDSAPRNNVSKPRKQAPAPINPNAPLPNNSPLSLQSAPAIAASKAAATPSSATLMPPPSVRPSALKPLPRLNGSLNPPPSSASSLRGPLPRSLQAPQTAGLAPSISTLPPSSRPSRKVLLDPGHSPLDWAHLTKNPPTPTFLRGDTVPQRLVKVTPSQIRQQNGRKGRDAWGTYQGKVYNLTPYMKFHPGGVGELMRGAGKIGEAEKLFGEIHPWVNWDGILGECLVGILVSEGDSEVGEKDLESMD